METQYQNKIYRKVGLVGTALVGLALVVNLGCEQGRNREDYDKRSEIKRTDTYPSWIKGADIGISFETLKETVKEMTTKGYAK